MVILITGGSSVSCPAPPHDGTRYQHFYTPPNPPNATVPHPGIPLQFNGKGLVGSSCMGMRHKKAPSHTFRIPTRGFSVIAGHWKGRALPFNLFDPLAWADLSGQLQRKPGRNPLHSIPFNVAPVPYRKGHWNGRACLKLHIVRITGGQCALHHDAPGRTNAAPALN